MSKIKSVFITGMTTTQCLGEKSKLGVITMPVVIKNHLNSVGIDTNTGQPHEYGGEDVILMGLGSPNSFVSRGTSDCAILWDNCVRTRTPLLPYFDDWRFHKYSRYLYSARPGPRSVPYNLGKLKTLNHHQKLGQFDEDVWGDFIEWINEFPYSFLWPVFLIGNRSLITSRIKNKSAKPIDFDPSPMYNTHPADYVGANSKIKRWILPALMDYSGWVFDNELDWPIFDFGHHNSTMGRVHESEIQSWINDSWGNISIKYPHSGGGWWRPRYLMSATGGSIIVGDKAEMETMGYENLTIKNVEEMTYSQLVDLAIAQREQLETNVISTLGHSHDVLMRALESAAKENVLL